MTIIFFVQLHSIFTFFNPNHFKIPKYALTLLVTVNLCCINIISIQIPKYALELWVLHALFMVNKHHFYFPHSLINNKKSKVGHNHTANLNSNRLCQQINFYIFTLTNQLQKIQNVSKSYN